MQLKDRVIVVTGAGRGLGKAIATCFAREGGKLVIAARSLTEIEQTTKEIIATGGQAISVQTDVTNQAQVKRLFEQVNESYGYLDILVNNAGLGIFGPFDELTAEALDAMIAVNLKGLVYASQEAFAWMKQTKGGHIVNILSTAAKTAGRANESGYSASKWAAAGLTECLKTEGKAFGIHVTSYCPGGMNTSFWNLPSAREHQPHTEKFMDPNEVAKILLAIVTLPASLIIDDIVVKRG